jgi:hypothetical protein
MTGATFMAPRIPYLVMNNSYACRLTGERGFQKWNQTIRQCALNDGRFKEDAFIIAIECKKYVVTDAIKLGFCFSPYEFFGIFNMLSSRKNRVYDFEFLTEPLESLTFEQAREQIIEHICKYRLLHGSGEGEKTFRTRMARCENMSELLVGRPNTDPKTIKKFQWIGGISFYGKWPF